MEEKYEINFISISSPTSTEMFKHANDYNIDVFIFVLNNIRVQFKSGSGQDRKNAVLKLIKYLKKRYNKPIIALCGWNFEDHELEIKSKLAGADYYFPLPSDLKFIVNAIRSCLEEITVTSVKDHNELPNRKQRNSLKNIEHPMGQRVIPKEIKNKK